MYFKSQSRDLTQGRGVPPSFLNEHTPNPPYLNKLTDCEMIDSHRMCSESVVSLELRKNLHM